MNYFDSFEPFLLTKQCSYSFIDIGKIASHLCAQFEKAGIKPGHPIAISPEISVESICVLLAALLRGNQVFIVSSREPVAKTKSWLRQFGCHHLLMEKTENSPHSLKVTNILSFDFSPLGSIPRRLPYGWTVFCTSGSTAAPKAVVHTISAHERSAQGVCQFLKLHKNRWLLNLPLYHVGGFSIVMRALNSRSSILLDPDAMGASHISLVPTQLATFIKSRYKLRQMRTSTIILGGAPAPAHLLQQVKSLGVKVIQSYGSTETASLVVAREGDTSTVLPHAEINIEENGAIKVAARSMTKGYLTNKGLQKICDFRGWYNTGDIGSFPHKGLFEILGRADSMMISGGENIHPEEIEEAIASCPGVVRATVIAISDERFGQRPIAFVQMLPQIDSHLLRTHLSSTVARYKIPDAFYELPKGFAFNGLKISRVQLADHYRSTNGDHRPPI